MSKMKRRGSRPDATGRSLGKAKHVRFYEWELKSSAYEHLSPAGRSLLIEFKRLYNGENNGALFMSVRDAAGRLKVSINFARKALAELEAKGFIRPRDRGSFTMKSKQATTWILTEYEFAGQPSTKDFMRWQPPATVSPEDTVAEIDSPSKKQNTVSPGDRHGITGRYRGGAIPPRNVADGITGRYREGQIHAATVSPEDTQLVYQGGGLGNGQAEPLPSPQAKQQPPHRPDVTKPNGKPIDLEEAIGMTTPEAETHPTKFGDSPNVEKRPWSKPKIEEVATPFGLYVWAERTLLGMSLAELGERTGLGEAGIENIEHQRATASRVMKKRVVAALTDAAGEPMNGTPQP